MARGFLSVWQVRHVASRGDRLSDAVFASHLAESAAAIEKIRRLLRDVGNDSDQVSVGA
jgi:hypothetical protein